MSKIEEVRSDMFKAMKAGDKETKESLSMLLAALKNKAIDKRADLTAEEEVQVILKEIKQTKEALEMTPEDRTDIIGECTRRLAVLEQYAPKMMDEKEIREIISATLAELCIEAPTAKDKGRIMKVLMPKVKAFPNLMNHLSIRPVPEIIRKAPVFLLDRPENLCIGHRGPDFQTVADDARILPDFLQLFFPIGADLLQVKAVERALECLLLVQDALPRKPGLKAFQDQHLKKFLVVVHRDAPYLVMITDIPLVLRVRPAASYLSIRPFHLCCPPSVFPLFYWFLPYLARASFVCPDTLAAETFWKGIWKTFLEISPRGRLSNRLGSLIIIQ